MEQNFRHASGPSDPMILLSDKTGYYYTRLSEIVYCASDNSYTEIFLTNGQQIIVSKPLKYYEQLTAAFGFFRVHQSHLINTMHLLSILQYENIWQVQMSNNYLLPISRDRKKMLLKKLEQQSLSDSGPYQKSFEPIAIKPKRRAVLQVNREFNTDTEEKILNVHTG